MNNQEELNIVEDTTVSSASMKNNFVGISKLLKVISNVDALVIFSMAKDGIESDTMTHSKIGMTRKQYYTRLMQLKRAGLIEKKGDSYLQTTMGSFLQENCMNPVFHAIRNSKKMVMIDVLTNNGNFSQEDLSQMKNAVCKVSLGGTD